MLYMCISAAIIDLIHQSPISYVTLREVHIAGPYNILRDRHGLAEKEDPNCIREDLYEITTSELYYYWCIYDIVRLRSASWLWLKGYFWQTTIITLWLDLAVPWNDAFDIPLIRWGGWNQIREKVPWYDITDDQLIEIARHYIAVWRKCSADLAIGRAIVVYDR